MLNIFLGMLNFYLYDINLQSSFLRKLDFCYTYVQVFKKFFPGKLDF